MDRTRATVLVVHDVVAIQDVIGLALASAACTTIRAARFASAAQLDDADIPDIIIADELIITADPGGFRDMRARFPGAVVVALVAPFRMRTGRIDGVDCTVEKPIADGRLRRAVEWGIEVARGRAEAVDQRP